jgi:hypothetical protein
LGEVGVESEGNFSIRRLAFITRKGEMVKITPAGIEIQPIAKVFYL